MRVLHLSYRGLEGGGAAVATRRLHFALRRIGVESQILCAKNPDESSHIQQFRGPRIWRRFDPLLRALTRRMGLNNVFDISSFTMKKQQAWLDADVVNIHSYADFFSYLALGPLTETKPTVMTLHDMWSFTGHCYVSFDCERWKTGCGKCPYPDVYPPIRRDSTHIEWKLKNWAYRHAQLTVVAPSTAYAEFARQSMLGRFPVRHVPHGIDTACYEPLDRQQCRSLLGVPPDKKVLMFMAKSLHSSVKGGQVLTEVFRRLPRAIKDRLILLLVGNQGKMMADALGVQAIDCGYISNDRLKAICYSAADLFVHPTRAEAFGLVLLESMACGTPLVSFNVGGVSDLVRPGVTGYLAERDNAEDLMSGVVQLLTDESRCESMRAQCREIALREYCIELQAQRYASLYAELLAGSTRCSDETKSLPVASHTQTSDGSRPSV